MRHRIHSFCNFNCKERREERSMAKPQEQDMPSFSSLNPPRHFFKIMLSPKLILPEGFLDEFGDDLTRVAKLRDPNERVWEVGVEKCESGVRFGDNWKEFLEFYSIGHGHFLVFKYEGNSCFRVLIFDHTACEISYPCTHADQIDNSGLLVSVDQNRGWFDEQIILHEDGGDNLNDELAIVSSCHQSNNGENNETDSDQIQANKKRKGKGERDMTGRKRRMCTKSSRRDHVTQEERLDAIQRARERMVRSENPSFDVVMRTHHIQNPHVYVQRAFCNKYMNGGPGWVSLEVADGRHWRVSYTYNHGPNSGKSLRKGWAAFHRENLLEEGDVCVFELLNPHQPDDLVFKVEIFRVVPLNGSEPDQTRPLSAVVSASPVIATRENSFF